MNPASIQRNSKQPYPRWHTRDHPYLLRKRLRLESLLGARCAYCGLTRDDGVNLQFHHPFGRDWQDSKGHAVTPRQLSWSQRLIRYAREIGGGLLTLACDQTGHNCHEEQKRLLKQRGHEASRLYDYDHTNSPF